MKMSRVSWHLVGTQVCILYTKSCPFYEPAWQSWCCWTCFVASVGQLACSWALKYCKSKGAALIKRQRVNWTLRIYLIMASTLKYSVTTSINYSIALQPEPDHVRTSFRSSVHNYCFSQKKTQKNLSCICHLRNVWHSRWRLWINIDKAPLEHHHSGHVDCMLKFIAMSTQCKLRNGCKLKSGLIHSFTWASERKWEMEPMFDCWTCEHS